MCSPRKSQSQFEIRSCRIRKHVYLQLVLFVLASCPRGTWSASAGLANWTPAKAIHDTIPPNVEESNKYYLDVANKRINPSFCLANEKNRNAHPTSGPHGLDACISPTKDYAGHKNQELRALTPEELLVIDALVLQSEGPQLGQTQSRNINLLPSQGLLPSGQTKLSGDETTNHEEHASGPSSLDDEPEIAASTTPTGHPPEPTVFHDEAWRDLLTWKMLLTVGVAICAVWYVYIKLCGATRYVQSSLTFVAAGRHLDVRNDIESPEAATAPPLEKLQLPSESAGMDDNSLLDLGGSQALLQALRRVEGVGEEVGVERVLEDDFFRANHLSSEDQAAVRRYRHYVGVAKEFTKPLSVRHGEYLTSPTNREVDSLSRVPETRRVRASPSPRDS